MMVLVGIAIILLFSIHRYRDYQRRIQIAGVKNDVARVQQALNSYYHTEGCRTDGHFAGDKAPSIGDLGLALRGRPPLVPLGEMSYTASIEDTKEQTSSEKPVYALQVTATFNSAYSSERMRWYQKRLGAERVSGHTLIWTSLPSNTALAPGTKLWVMKSEGELFRQMENKLRQEQATTHPDISPSYCAH